MKSELAISANKKQTWVIAGNDSEEHRLISLKNLGIKIIQVPSNENGHVDLCQVLCNLAENGITRLLIEGGSGIATAFLREVLVDEISWFRASTIMGGDGIPAVLSYGLTELKDIKSFRTISVEKIGKDYLETYRQPK